MTKRDKREQAIRRSPNSVRFNDLDALLQESGFIRIEGAGSHIKYRHPLFRGIVTVSPHGATIKPYQVKQAIAALDAIQAEEDTP
jgi:predicted RNA binding protein YcfA (HicA-like mRNA interferase family)